MKKLTLQNGLNIWVQPMMNTHSVTVGLYVRAGARYESAYESGITHLLEHMHFRELCGMAQNELYYTMERMGSTLRAATYYDFLKFTMKIHPEDILRCTDIFKRILETNSWSEKNLNAEKMVVMNQIREGNYTFSLKSDIRKSIFGNCSLARGIMGEEENIDNISAERLAEYKSSTFNKNNMVLCITGCINDVDFNAMCRELEQIEIPDGEKNMPCGDLQKLYKRKPDVTFVNGDWNYIDVNVSFDLDYNTASVEELEIINCILGEGVGSWLQINIRERMNFTSDICSEIEWYEDFAVLHVKFSVDKKWFYDCLESIFETIRKLKTEITVKDLDVSIPFYFKNRTFLEDDTEEMNFTLGYEEFVLNRKAGDSLENNTATADSLMYTARKIFIPEKLNVVVCGNCRSLTKKKIREISNIKLQKFAAATTT